MTTKSYTYIVHCQLLLNQALKPALQSPNLAIPDVYADLKPRLLQKHTRVLVLVIILFILYFHLVVAYV